jgi:hypothetical protein
VKELTRIVRRQQAYDILGTALEAGNTHQMRERLHQARALDPEDCQIPIWFAIRTCDVHGELELAREVLADDHEWDMDWRAYIQRYIDAGQAHNPALLQKLLD